MKRLLLASALLAAMASAASADDNIFRWYGVEGQNANGTQYGGWATIFLRDGRCEIEWEIEPPTDGLCIRNGDLLAVGYPLGLKLGVSIYRLMPDGALEGRWVLQGEQPGYEALVPLEKDPGIPLHEFQGQQ